MLHNSTYPVRIRMHMTEPTVKCTNSSDTYVRAAAGMYEIAQPVPLKHYRCLNYKQGTDTHTYSTYLYNIQ